MPVRRLVLVSYKVAVQVKWRQKSLQPVRLNGIAGLSIRGVIRGYANKQFALEKALELYSREYDIIYPHEERPAGRPARTSPLYHRLQEKGAQFGASAGWERATWFPPAGVDATEQPSYHRTNWF